MGNRCRVFHNTFGGIWFKQMIFREKGDFKTPHVHNFDHVTFIMSGAVKVYKIDVGEDSEFDISKKVEIGTFKAPCHIEVPKEVVHYVESLEDNTMAYCVEAVKEDMQTICFDD